MSEHEQHIPADAHQTTVLQRRDRTFKALQRPRSVRAGFLRRVLLKEKSSLAEQPQAISKKEII